MLHYTNCTNIPAARQSTPPLTNCTNTPAAPLLLIVLIYQHNNCTNIPAAEQEEHVRAPPLFPPPTPPHPTGDADRKRLLTEAPPTSREGEGGGCHALGGQVSVAEASLECVSRQAAATLLAAALAGASREGGKSRDPPPPPQSVGGAHVPSLLDALSEDEKNEKKDAREVRDAQIPASRDGNIGNSVFCVSICTFVLAKQFVLC